MKPHRIKHMREKAIRETSTRDVAKERKNEREQKLKKHKIRLITEGDMHAQLKPLDVAKAKFILNYFMKHWEREAEIRKKNFHRHKRTTPGEVEGEGPYTVIENFPNVNEKRWKKKNLAQRNDIDHKMIKIQNQHHKKAA